MVSLAADQTWLGLQESGGKINCQKIFSNFKQEARNLQEAKYIVKNNFLELCQEEIGLQEAKSILLKSQTKAQFFVCVNIDVA